MAYALWKKGQILSVPCLLITGFLVNQMPLALLGWSLVLEIGVGRKDCELKKGLRIWKEEVSRQKFSLHYHGTEKGRAHIAYKIAVAGDLRCQ